jgi:hypothetical protein
LKDILIDARYIVLDFNSLMSYLLKDILIETIMNYFSLLLKKKVERCKIVELFKARRELIRLKILFSIRLLLSEAKL